MHAMVLAGAGAEVDPANSAAALHRPHADCEDRTVARTNITSMLSFGLITTKRACSISARQMLNDLSCPPTTRRGTSITRLTPSEVDTPRKIMTISTQSPSRLRTLEPF